MTDKMFNFEIGSKDDEIFAVIEVAAKDKCEARSKLKWYLDELFDKNYAIRDSYADIKCSVYFGHPGKVAATAKLQDLIEAPEPLVLEACIHCGWSKEVAAMFNAPNCTSGDRNAQPHEWEILPANVTISEGAETRTEPSDGRSAT